MGALLADEPHVGLIPFVVFVAGVLTYFALPFEPNGWVLSSSAILLLGLCFIRCSRIKKILYIVTPLFFIAGILVPCVHAGLTHTRFIPHAVLNAEVSGLVIDTRILSNRAVIDIVPHTIRRQNETKEWEPVFLPYEMPDKIRLTVYGVTAIQRGDTITGTVSRLVQPAPPLTPHSPSQAPSFWFEGIAATGVMFRPTITPTTVVLPTNKWIHKLNPLRSYIHFVFHRVFSEENAGIAEALVLGNTDFVADSSRSLYRVLGLSHILAVSGFHISLITFLIFALVRFGLNLMPEIISGITIRRIAAVSAIIVAGFYTILSGAQIPVIRAFIMILLVMMAVFFDKRPMTIRNVLIAAVLMLCVAPEMILSVSFQLSFMAIICLVGMCVAVQKKMRSHARSWPMKIFGGLMTFILFNVLVTIATLPYIGYYFHQMQPYAVIGNVLLSSVFGLAIIPLLFVGVVLINTPIGIGLLGLVDWLLTLVYHIGMPIASWPFATLPVPPFYAYGLVLWSFGLIGFTLFRTKIRWLFAMLMGLSVLSFVGIEKPIGMIGAGGNYIAVRDKNGISVTERFYYPRWHAAFLMYDNVLPEKYTPNPLFRSFISMNGLMIGQTPYACANNAFNIKRKGMENCPRLIAPAELWDMHTICVYQNNGKFEFWISGNGDKNRPWHAKGGKLPVDSEYSQFKP